MSYHTYHAPIHPALPYDSRFSHIQYSGVDTNGDVPSLSPTPIYVHTTVHRRRPSTAQVQVGLTLRGTARLPVCLLYSIPTPSYGNYSFYMPHTTR